MCIVCNNKLNFIMQLPKLSNNTYPINETIEIFPVFRFKESKKSAIQDLFYWDTYVHNYLNLRKRRGCVTLEDKKHRLLCYFFDSTVETLTNILSNVSGNPGCEIFSLIFNKGWNNNANMGEILELDIEACDLLPVIIDTST